MTADDGSFDSGILEGGATFSQAFAAPGTFDYTCLIHPEMRGTITVTGDAVAVAPSVLPAAAAPPSTVSLGIAILRGIAILVGIAVGVRPPPPRPASR